ncbi:MAG TPA: divergent polysaccharide deacetylase family protein, partial [Rectinemataceae bacterium]
MRRKKSESTRRILLALIALALIGGLAFLASLSERRVQEARQGPASVPTTAWPHGNPEYVVEVPPGYEDLLPGTDHQAQKDIQPVSQPQNQLKSREKQPTPLSREGTPCLIFVIDDAGYSMAQLEPFLKLPFPITIAVLPGVPHSAE